MKDLERHISMCARHYARFRRMAEYASTKEERIRMLERAEFWIQKQDALVSIFEMKE